MLRIRDVGSTTDVETEWGLHTTTTLSAVADEDLNTRARVCGNQVLIVHPVSCLATEWRIVSRDEEPCHSSKGRDMILIIAQTQR